MRERPLILVIDDALTNGSLVSAALRSDYDVLTATSGEDGIAVALDELPDLVLLDVLMPGIDGYEVCQRLKDDTLLADVPVIFMTMLHDQEAEMRGLSLGAIDFLHKPIVPAIVRAKVHNHIGLKLMRDRLAEMAVTDALTGLSNRRRLEQWLALETARLSRQGEWLSTFMLDIDFFKQFNDTYGHPEGDRCIAMVASALQRAVRSATELTARYGGEEFACVLPRIPHGEAMAIAEHVGDHVRQLGIPHLKSAADACVTVSIGVATARCLPGMTPELWIDAADKNLYAAKKSGRNRAVGGVFACTPEAAARC